MARISNWPPVVFQSPLFQQCIVMEDAYSSASFLQSFFLISSVTLAYSCLFFIHIILQHFVVLHADVVMVVIKFAAILSHVWHYRCSLLKEFFFTPPLIHSYSTFFILSQLMWYHYYQNSHSIALFLNCPQEDLELSIGWLLQKKIENLVVRRTAVPGKIDLSRCSNSVRLLNILPFLVKTICQPTMTIQAASYVCHMDKTSNDIREFFSVLRGKWRSILRSDVVVIQNLKF